MVDDTPPFVLTSRREIVRRRGIAKWSEQCQCYFVDGWRWNGTQWSDFMTGWHLGPEIVPSKDPTKPEEP